MKLINSTHLLSGMRSFKNNFLTYYFKIRPSRSPMFINWMITRKCNAKCHFCDAWKDTYSEELQHNQKIEFIDDLRRLRPWLLSISGGEPLQDQGIDEILARLHKHKIAVNLCTNGSSLKENTHMLLKNNVKSITVSADSDLGAEHDRGRGWPGLFDKACAGIEYFRSYRNSPKNIIQVRLLLHAKNISKLDQMLTFWEKRVDYILLQPLYNYQNEEYQKRLIDLLNYKKISFDNFNTVLKKHKINSPYNRDIPLYMQNKLCANNHCYSGAFFIHIDQKGSIWSCPDQKYNFGCIKHDRLEDILKSNQMQQQVQQIRKNRKCQCSFNCTMLNNYLRYFLPF